MNENDLEAFASTLFVAAEAFGETVSKTRAEAYFEALQDLELVDVQAAVRYAIRESRFFPRPSDLRGFVCGTADEAADEAWANRDNHPEILKQLGVSSYDLRHIDVRDLLRLREPFRAAFKREIANTERRRLLSAGRDIKLLT